MVKLTFEELMEMLISRHSTNMQGNEVWIDWDAIYADLLEEGYDSADASINLDNYMEENGYC
jgi:hypothetical protein